MAARLRAAGLGLILLLPAFAPAAAGSADVCAASLAGSPHAALVVDTGPRATTYCVALDAEAVSGIRLIELASAQHGLRYSLGFGGQAVCQLDGVGPTGGDCFADYPDFWGYWHGADGGGWAWAGSGAGGSSVQSGDVEGWSWGSGDSAATHAPPPAMTIDDVCTSDEEPGDAGGGSGGGTGGGSGGGTGGSNGDGQGPDASPGVGGEQPTDDGGASNGNGGGGQGHDSDGAGEADATVTGTATPSPDGIDEVAAASTPGGAGPPTGGLIAVGAIAVLLATGAVLVRRRASGGR